MLAPVFGVGNLGVGSCDPSGSYPSSVGSGWCPDTDSPSHSITVKDLKAMLPQVNYRVPNMRFLRDKLVVRTPPGTPTTQGEVL